MLSNQEQGTGSRSTPVRFVLEERLARMPAQEMVVHLLFVKLNLADGQWLVLFHGVLDVLLSYLVSMSEFHTLKIGSMPIKRQFRNRINQNLQYYVDKCL